MKNINLFISPIKLMLQHAPVLTLLKIFQIVVIALLIPFNIFISQQVIDNIVYYLTYEGYIQHVIFWVSMLLASSLITALFGGLFSNLIEVSIKRRINKRMSPGIMKKFISMDYYCFENPEIQDTIELMGDRPQDTIYTIFNRVLRLVRIIVSMIGICIVLLQAAWWFVAGFIVLFILATLLEMKSSSIYHDMMVSQTMDERRKEYLENLLSEKSSLAELTIFGAVNFIKGKWNLYSVKVLKEKMKASRKGIKFTMFHMLLLRCWTAFTIFGLIALATQGNVTLGLFTALIVSAVSITDSIYAFSSEVDMIKMDYLLTGHYYKFMKFPETKFGTEKITGIDTIRFDNVTFSYPDTEEVVLSNISFEVNGRNSIALVGENGAGKSTIIKLLCRLYTPDSGNIYINNVNLKDIDTESLQKSIAAVFQDFEKYTLTLRENVALGEILRINEDEAILESLRKGLANDFTDLDMNLGRIQEDGVDLSGGQWQRIALARGLFSSGNFIILDEPTASLDPMAESELYHGFVNTLKERGSLIVSHRLASAKMADTILVLANGCIAEQGTHDELIGKKGLYSEMYNTQSRWYNE